MAIQFQHNYRLLELSSSSDWSMAQKNYRRLVHACHPDRFAQRPRERIHAQHQFIELTKAFNNLRAFYREHHRLPYEPTKHAIADPSEPPAAQQVSSSDEIMFQTGILNKRKPSNNKFKAHILKPLLWIVPTGATILAGLVAFFIIDRNAKMITIEEAKRVLSTSKPSEYIRDDEKISQANNRAVLMNKPNSTPNMGGTLGQDLIK